MIKDFWGEVNKALLFGGSFWRVFGGEFWGFWGLCGNFKVGSIWRLLICARALPKQLPTQPLSLPETIGPKHPICMRAPLILTVNSVIERMFCVGYSGWTV